MTMKLLIADDSELVQASLLELFEGILGIEAIHTARTLGETLLAVSQKLPTFAILDFHLPDGHANQIIPAMKLIAPGLQITVLTNDASAFNRGKCRQAGADWFFDKSLELEDMLEVVRKQAALN